MNGYHFDMAKEGANQYSVQVSKRTIISGSNFSSALAVYKDLEERMENAHSPEQVCLVKEYDAKTKSWTEDIVRSNAQKIAKS